MKTSDLAHALLLTLKQNTCNWNNLETRLLRYVKYHSTLNITVLQTGMHCSWQGWQSNTGFITVNGPQSSKLRILYLYENLLWTF